MGALNTVVCILLLLTVRYKYRIFFTLAHLKSLFSICRHALFTNRAG